MTTLTYTLPTASVFPVDVRGPQVTYIPNKNYGKKEVFVQTRIQTIYEWMNVCGMCMCELCQPHGYDHTRRTD